LLLDRKSLPIGHNGLTLKGQSQCKFSISLAHDPCS